jgi:hypothetical protein
VTHGRAKAGPNGGRAKAGPYIPKNDAKSNIVVFASGIWFYTNLNDCNIGWKL